MNLPANAHRDPITTMADGTIKQVNPFSGTEVWTVPGAGHTGALDTAPQEWERRVVELFDAALLDGDAARS